MISVLIPAYNEAPRIGQTIKGVADALDTLNTLNTQNDQNNPDTINTEQYEIIVVDDGSLDDTAHIARSHGARVLTLTQNQGKGRAMNHGLKECHGEILLLLDADLGLSAGQIKNLLAPVLENRADLTIACFPKAQKKGGFGLVKGLATRGLYLCTKNLYYSPISGQRALKRQVMDSIGQFESGWGMEVAMTAAAYHWGYRILEIPLELSHRETERSIAGFKHRGKQFHDILLAFLKHYWQYHLKPTHLKHMHLKPMHLKPMHLKPAQKGSDYIRQTNLQHEQHKQDHIGQNGRKI